MTLTIGGIELAALPDTDLWHCDWVNYCYAVTSSISMFQIHRVIQWARWRSEGAETGGHKRRVPQ